MELLERDEALEAFADALRDAAMGRGRALLIRGPAGIGKTALVRHALETQASGARVLLGGCDDLATARPLGPLRDLAPHVAPELAALLRDGEAVDRLYDPWVDELQRAPTPVVLAIDDAHWADEATLDLLVYLLRRLERLPALVVLTFRSGLESTHPLRSVLGRVAASHVCHIDLRPLSHTAVAKLSGHLDPATVWQRTLGNPFLVTALAQHDDVTVPPSVQDAVLAELADLAPPERSLVELTAVVPSSVEIPVLDACRPGWEEHGMRPEQRGLLEVRDGAIAFRHELARQAVFQALPASRRRQLHRDVLEVLRERADDPARLVHHAIGADDVATLLTAGPEAARAARRAGAHRQALQHYERLVGHAAQFEVPDRARLWDEYASELMTADDPGTSRRAWEHARQLYETAGDVEGQARALNFLSGLAWIQHEQEEAERLENRALHLLEQQGGASRELAQAHVRRGGRHMTDWEFDDATAWAERGLAVAESLGDDVATANALLMLGTTLVTRGDVDAGLAALDRSIALAADARAYNLVALAHGNAAEALLDSARPDLVPRHLDPGRVAVDHHETAAVGGYVAGVHARFHAVRGEWDEAVETARDVWDGGPIEAVNQVVAVLAMARARIRRGDPPDPMRAVLAEVRRLRSEVQYVGPATALEAEAAWLADEPPPDGILEVLDRARATGQPWLIGDLATWAWRGGLLREAPDALPEPHALTVAGDPVRASSAWRDRGYPYEALLVLVDSDDVDVVRAAVEAADLLAAAPLADRLRRRLRELGVQRVPRGPQATTRENPGGLTDRQLEVLRHVAAGRTNAEIADALVLSVRTVDHHVSATLAKLGVSSRREAAELAAELGIVPAG